MRISLSPILIYFALCLACLAADKPSPDSWQAVRDKQPTGLHVTLKLPKTHYHMGEVIYAQLTFSNETKDTYHLSGATGGRSGRNPEVAFRARKEDGSLLPDPLQWYYEHFPQMGGGGSIEKRLGPWEISLVANQWVQFEKPGTYQLYAWTSRVVPGEPRKAYEPQTPAVELVSDPVEIAIDPLPAEEEKAIIEEATRDLANSHAWYEEEAYNALARLRYLRTPASFDALLRFVDDIYGQEAILGFYGRPNYQESAAKILAAVREGRVGISDRLLQLYYGLKNGSMWVLTPGPDGLPSDHAAREELYAAARGTITPDGTGDEFFTNLFALYRRDPKDPAIRAILIKRQLDLPPKQIEAVFGDEFGRPHEDGLLSDKDFLPLIRELAKPEKHNPKALEALAKAAPEEARPIILEDIRLNRPIFVSTRIVYTNRDFRALAALPDREWPELDPMLRERLSHGPQDQPSIEATMLLIDRYATKALLPDVVRIYRPNEGHWQCVLQAAVLRYWIRCDPKAGVEALGRALQKNAPGETGCFHTVLLNVLEKAWVDEALPLVVAATGNDDHEVVRYATQLLEAHAGPEAIENVIAAIERAAAKPLPDAPSQRHEQVYAPVGLTNFLLNSKRWLLTRPQLERLLKVVKDAPLQERLKAKLVELDK